MLGHTVPAVAHATGLHPATIRRNIERGRIRAVRDLAGWWRISSEECERLRALYSGKLVAAEGDAHAR